MTIIREKKKPSIKQIQISERKQTHIKKIKLELNFNKQELQVNNKIQESYNKYKVINGNGSGEAENSLKKGNGS